MEILRRAFLPFVATDFTYHDGETTHTLQAPPRATGWRWPDLVLQTDAAAEKRLNTLLVEGVINELPRLALIHEIPPRAANAVRAGASSIHSSSLGRRRVFVIVPSTVNVGDVLEDERTAAGEVRSASANRGWAVRMHLLQGRPGEADQRPDDRVVLRAALAHYDVASKDFLAAEAFHAEALGVRIAAVTRRAACFFVGQRGLPGSAAGAARSN